MELFSREDTIIISPPPGVVPNFVDPPSIGGRITVSSLVLGIIALCFVCLRVGTKRFLTKFLGWDDFFSVAAMIAAIARIVISIILVKRVGVGRHIWDVPPSHFTSARNLQWIEDMIYLLGIMFAKLAVLSLYLNIFGPNKRFRYLCYTMIAVSVTYCIIFIFLYAFNCRPEYYSWHVSAGVQPAKCMEITHIIMAIGAFNLVTDLIILIMPLPLIWRLNLRRNQKWGLLAIFTTGLFVVITTLVRLIIVVTTLTEVDQTYVSVKEIIWLTVELDIAIICGCLPALAPLYSRSLTIQYIPTSLRNFLSRSFSAPHSIFSWSRGRSSKESSTYGKRNSSDHNSDVVLVDMDKASGTDTRINTHKSSTDYHASDQLPQGRIGMQHTVEQYSSPRGGDPTKMV